MIDCVEKNTGEAVAYHGRNLPPTLAHTGQTEQPGGCYLFVVFYVRLFWTLFTEEMLLKPLLEISTLFTLLPLYSYALHIILGSFTQTYVSDPHYGFVPCSGGVRHHRLGEAILAAESPVQDRPL